MDINRFSTIGYFIKSYFNWSTDWSELENCIEEFLIREQVETVEALKKEIEIMYRLNDPELIRKVSYRLGDRGLPDDKAIRMVALLYAKAWGC